MIVLDQVPDIGKHCDRVRRQRHRDYARDAVAHVEASRKIIFDMGRSVGGDLTILKTGSWIPTRVIYLLP